MTCRIIWTPEAQKDLAFWKSKDRAILSKISRLIQSIETNPQAGIGKPERLKYQDKNLWSRRIDRRHRLIYLLDDDGVIFIIQCRFHYDEH